MRVMPIILPISNSGGESNCIYPSWVMNFTKIGIAITLFGLIALLICALMYMVTDNDIFNPVEKPGLYTFVVCIGGLVITLIGAVLMLFTGVEIME